MILQDPDHGYTIRFPPKPIVHVLQNALAAGVLRWSIAVGGAYQSLIFARVAAVDFAKIQCPLLFGWPSAPTQIVGDDVNVGTTLRVQISMMFGAFQFALQPPELLLLRCTIQLALSPLFDFSYLPLDLRRKSDKVSAGFA